MEKPVAIYDSFGMKHVLSHGRQRILRTLFMPSTIAIFSSARRNGNTGKLIDRIAADLGIEIVDLATKRIAPFDYDHRNRDDDFEPLMEHVLSHEQVIFASPIYWYSVTPEMKNFFDRITDYLDLPDLLEKGRKLRKMSAYVVCTSASDAASPSFISTFRETFGYLGMRFGGFIHLNCADGYSEKEVADDIERFEEAVRAGIDWQRS